MTECRVQMSLYRDLVIYYVLYHGLASLLCNSSPAGVTVPPCASHITWCSVTNRTSCAGVSSDGGYFVTQQPLDKSLWPGRQNFLTGVGQRPSTFKPDWEWERWIPRRRSSTIRRGKGFWAGKALNVLSRTLRKWPTWRPLFVLSHFDIFPIISPQFPPQHFNQVVVYFFNSWILGINHIFYVFMEIIQGEFLEHLRMILMWIWYY